MKSSPAPPFVQSGCLRGPLTRIEGHGQLSTARPRDAGVIGRARIDELGGQKSHEQNSRKQNEEGTENSKDQSRQKERS